MHQISAPALRRGRGRPRKDDAPDSSMILNAALTAFARYGWEGTNLRQVAEASGVDTALIARRFDGKMGLWCAIVDHVSDVLRAAFDAAAAAGTDDPRQRLQTTIDHFVRMNMEIPDLGRFFIDQIARPGQRRAYVIEKMWESYRAMMLPVMEDAHRAGILPSGSNPATTVALLLGAVSMPLLMRATALEDMDDPAARDDFVREVTGLFTFSGAVPAA